MLPDIAGNANNPTPHALASAMAQAPQDDRVPTLNTLQFTGHGTAQGVGCVTADHT
jgi:hypothetical protein